MSYFDRFHYFNFIDKVLDNILRLRYFNINLKAIHNKDFRCENI